MGSIPSKLRRVPAGFASLAVALLAAASAPAAPPAGRPAPLPRALDLSGRIDVNQLSMVVTNFGSIAFDLQTGSPGLEFPRGSGRTVAFAAGLWVGAEVDGQPRVTVAEYGSEFGPGPIVGSGAGAQPDDPNRAEHRVYTLRRSYASAATRDSVLFAYAAGAVPHGAPPVSVLGDGTLDIEGDQMLWAVYNDLAPHLHTSAAGGTAPLGIEVRQTTFAYDRPGALGHTVWIRYRILNRGPNRLDGAFLSMWADPDVGGPGDDLVGCDVSRGLGFAYNATNSDIVYLDRPPSVGFDVVRGPSVAGGPLPLTAFAVYVNGTDPIEAAQSYAYMQGLDAGGNPVLDPTTSQPTRFALSGDPVAGTGWIDSDPSDRRMMLSCGPFTLEPADSQEVVVAIVVGQGADRLAGVTAMKAHDDEIQSFHDATTPTLLAFFHAAAGPEGIELRWRLSPGFADPRLERAPAPGGPWRAAAVERREVDGVTVALDRGAEPGRVHHYRLLGRTREGGEVVLGQLAAAAGAAVAEVELAAFPNPAAGRLQVRWSMPRPARVRLDLLDLQGRRAASLADLDLPGGRHQAAFDARELPAGLYVLRLRAGAEERTRRVVLAP